MTEEQRKRLYCNSCRQETNHQLKGEHRYEFEVSNGADAVVTYRLWACLGCETAHLEQGGWIDGEGEESFEYFPERSEFTLSAKPYSKLKPKLKAIYKEAIACYNAKALILSAVGLRALLEGICHDKKVKGKNLKVKIDGLQKFLPNKNIIRNLHHFRFMGNDAVHELEAPKAAEVALAISVIEDLLNFLYELDYKASQLREMRRNKKRKVPKPVSLADLAKNAYPWKDSV